jgi:hypothetical protein
MKIRIIELIGNEVTDYDDYSRTIYTLEDITDWEDVNEEELEALTLYVKEHQQYDRKTVLVTEKMLDYKATIATYLEKAKKVREKHLEQEKKRNSNYVQFGILQHKC